MKSNIKELRETLERIQDMHQCRDYYAGCDIMYQCMTGSLRREYARLDKLMKIYDYERRVVRFHESVRT
jgi:hypothetical protein